MAKFLDNTGLQALINKIKSSFMPNEGNTKTGNLSISRSGDVGITSTGGDITIQTTGTGKKAYYGSATANNEIAIKGDLSSGYIPNAGNTKSGVFSISRDDNIILYNSYGIIDIDAYDGLTLQIDGNNRLSADSDGIEIVGNNNNVWVDVGYIDDAAVIIQGDSEVHIRDGSGHNRISSDEVGVKIESNVSTTFIDVGYTDTSEVVIQGADYVYIRDGSGNNRLYSNDDGVKIQSDISATFIDVGYNDTNNVTMSANTNMYFKTTSGKAYYNPSATPLAREEIATIGDIDDKIAAADAMVYKGIVYPSNDSIAGHNHLPTSGVVVGDTYKAAGTTAGSTYATGVTANLGDLIIAQTVTTDSQTGVQTITWDVIESGNDIVGITAGNGLTGGGTSGTITLAVDLASNPGLELTGTDGSKKLTAKVTNGLILTSDGIGHSNTSKSKSAGFYTITVDAQGHVSAASDVTSTDIAGAGGVTSITAGNGLTGGGSPSSGVVSLAVDPGNGIELTGTSGSQKVAVKIDSTNANGLAVTSSGVKLGLASTSDFGAAKVTDGHGLAIANGVITMSNATSSADGAMSSTDKAKLDLLQALPTAVGTYTYNVTTAGTAGSYTAMQFISTTDIDNMWAGTYSAS